MLTFGLQDIKAQADQAKAADAKTLCEQADNNVIGCMEDLLKLFGPVEDEDFITRLRTECNSGFPVFMDTIAVIYSAYIAVIPALTNFTNQFLQFPIKESIPALKDRINALPQQQSSKATR